jgi:nitronate monooxygenase
MSSRLSPALSKRLRLPVIAAPMLRVSGPDLVVAASRAGIIGAFPTANARGASELNDWLAEITERVDPSAAPVAPNLIIRQPKRDEHLAVLVEHRVEMVITSVGSPAPVIDDLHRAGVFVLSDVANLAHAGKAADAGADGLVLLTAGAGGQTGWMNPLAFASAVRSFFDGVLVLAGGISDGRALLAAQVMGCDLAYMGTKLIATPESMASPSYREMLVRSSMDDVLTTRAFTGLPTNMLLPAILEAGLDPARLDEDVSVADADRMYGGRQQGPGPTRWQDVFSAGHSVSGVPGIRPVREVVGQMIDEYTTARRAAVALWKEDGQ